MTYFNVNNYMQRRKALKLGIRLRNTEGFRSKTPTFLEEKVRLSDIVIDLPETVITELKIGAFSYIRSQSNLMSVSEIGRFCSIGRNVVIGQDPRNHPLSWVSTSPVFSTAYDSKVSPATIGHDVWIGHNAVIFAGIKIGHGAVIGMNAVVTKDVPAYTIVAGNPAKQIKKRFDDETINLLLASNWWEYSISELKKYDFSQPVNFAKQSHLLREKVSYDSLVIQNKKVKL